MLNQVAKIIFMWKMNFCFIKCVMFKDKAAVTTTVEQNI